jgi:hypothetical protein
MPSRFEIEHMDEALAERRFPTVTVWNRLEGRPRTGQFDRALKAEVRDALWMLTRQWQMGEFRGEDAGSPVFARLHLATTRLTKYRPRALAAEPFGENAPLEATVERRPLPLVRAGREISLDLRLVMGRQWLKMTAGVGDYREAFIDHYGIELPATPGPGDADRFAHPEAWQAFAAVAGRRMDGGKLYLHLIDTGANHAYDGVAGVDPADHAALDEQAERFVRWFERLFLQPADAQETAWVPERLEYQFSCSAPGTDGEEVFVAEEYAQGRLDWYSVDFDADSEGLGEVPDAPETGLPPGVTHTMVPAPVTYDGMPNTRWWAFEDGRTNFGAIDAATTDLAKLLFIEFGLVFANDWFVIPSTLATGSNARVRGLAVTTVFGERFWIEAAGSGDDEDWQRWSMFTLSTRGESSLAADTGLLLLPTVPKVQEADPAEAVLMVRDEIANMVWGVEQTVSLASGHARRGLEAAHDTRRYFERLAGPPADGPPPPAADVRYRVITSVPENWIPFVPARVEGSSREIQLQRAGMQRVIESVATTKVEPRTALLREGLERTPAQAYFIHEEEVPRTGIQVRQSFQRTRWRDGRVVVWLGAQKRVARGEASSGLAFDQLVDVPREG